MSFDHVDRSRCLVSYLLLMYESRNPRCLSEYFIVWKLKNNDRLPKLLLDRDACKRSEMFCKQLSEKQHQQEQHNGFT